MVGFAKISISNDSMATLMYAIFITKSKLLSVHHLGLEKYSRRQNTGNCVDVVLEVHDSELELFESLSGISLKTSKEFQGEMHVN